jgi:hypothetical protein
LPLATQARSEYWMFARHCVGLQHFDQKNCMIRSHVA